MALERYDSGEVAHLPSIGDSATRTVALVKTHTFQTIHLVVRAGEEIAPHEVSGSMTLYCIEGHIEFVGSNPPELRSGDWVYLAPGVHHEVRAVKDSSLLLTIMFDQPGA